MPLREYECEKCGTRVEDLYWNEYPRSIRCSRCGGKAVYRISDTKYEKLGDRQPKRFKVDFRSGEYDWGAGRAFNSKQERDRWMHETNCTRRKDAE